MTPLHGAALAALLLYGLSRSIKRYRQLGYHGASVLLSRYTRGVRLMSIAEGKLENLHYSAFITNMADTLIVRIELPFAARLQLVNIPVHAPGRPQPLRNLEVVSLEGDYHKYFALYCRRGQQMEARYILDPEAMTFVIDFCRHFAWEIVDNELYLVQPPGSGHDVMFNQIMPFIEQIRPAVERPLTPAELRAITPYGQDRRASLACPVCKAAMPNVDSHFSCPHHHGTLLTGTQLVQLKKGDLRLAARHQSTAPERGDIPCPACGKQMHRVPYNGQANLVIDSCINCPYRWLDSLEVHTLAANTK